MTQAVLESECLNCGAELRGDFCHVCGQKTASTRLGLHDVFHEVTHEFLHLDGKIITTLKVLITRPGQLTKDLVAGRRVRHVTPLRLYLTTSILFFFLAALIPSQGFVTFKDDDGRVLTPTAEQQRQADAITSQVIAIGPRVVFVLMPLFALLTFAFYRRVEPHFVAHVYHALHVHAFAFLLFAVSAPLRPIDSVGRGIGGVIGLWLFPYFYLSLRRFSGESWRRTIAKGTAIGVLYLAVIILAMATTFMVVMRPFQSE
jgi:hypothetical protein